MHGPLSHIERPELVDRRDLSLLVDRKKERGESRRERREQERKERTGEKGEREMRDSIIICAAASKPAPHAAETQGRRTVICIITSFSLLHVPTCTIELLYSAKCNQQQHLTTTSTSTTTSTTTSHLTHIKATMDKLSAEEKQHYRDAFSVFVRISFFFSFFFFSFHVSPLTHFWRRCLSRTKMAMVCDDHLPDPPT